VKPTNRPILTKEALLASIRQKNLQAIELSEGIMVKLEDLGLTARGLPSCVNYGVEVAGDFLSILSLYPTNVWVTVPIRATERLDYDWFRNWKQRVNEIARFYKPDSIAERTNKGALGPRYESLKGKVESLMNLVNEMKGQLLKSRPAHTDREQTLATNI